MSEAENKMEHVCLIDGSGFIFRAYYGLPPMTRADGTPVNAVYGFCSMLMRTLSEMNADHVAVLFDKDRKTFRSDIYPDYKAHRPPAPDDLVPQFDLIREAVQSFDVACLDEDGFEADDLIATYAKEAVDRGAKVTIISGDKDLMQLVDDGRVFLFEPMKNVTVDTEGVHKKFGVGPERVIDVQALAGDSSDNVPGVPGIGLKTAAQLINEYGDLDTLLARAEEIKQPKRRQNLIEFADQARISRDLVTLRQDAPMRQDLDSFRTKAPDPDRVMAFIRAQDFKSLAPRVERWLIARNGEEATPTIVREQVETNYSLITDTKTLDTWLAEATETGLLALDTETTGLNPLKASLVGISIASESGKAAYIPLAHQGKPAQASFDLLMAADTEQADDAPKQLPLKEVVQRLNPVLTDPSVLKVGHNLKYDMHILRQAGFAIPVSLGDTMLMSSAAFGNLHGHSLDHLADRYLGVSTIKYEDVCGKGAKQITFDQVPVEKAGQYAAEDADITLRLYHLFFDMLRAEKRVSVYERIERPLLQILTEMETKGVLVDTAALTVLSDKFDRQMQLIEKEIHSLAGEEFNVASPKQLGEILFEKMGLKGGKKSKKTGAYTTNAAILESLAAEGEDLPQKVLDWRQLAKLKSTYTDALIAQKHPETGRVHTSYSQTVTTTGRLSSNDPNLQNIPVRTEKGRQIRQAFVPQEDHILLAADYSQIELRLMAHVARVAALKEAFIMGEDIHTATAAQVFDVSPDQVDATLRRRAKTINFGIIYGISPFGLANQLDIPQKEAKAYIEAYFARFPEIEAYMEETKQQAFDQGYVTTPFGRICHTPEIRDKNPSRRHFSERAAINAPIQGGAADIIKKAMIRVDAELKEKMPDVKMLLQVHDELVFEVPKRKKNAAIDLIRLAMEEVVSLSVPLIVDIGTGKNWDEAH